MNCKTPVSSELSTVNHSHDAHCEILYLVGQLRDGGLERQLYYLVSGLDRIRYNPVVVVWNLNPSEKYYDKIRDFNVPIYGFPLDWSPLSKLRAFRLLVLRIAPKVIHSYSFYTNFAAQYAAWGRSAVAIGSVRGEFSRAKAEGGLVRGALNARWPSVHISNSVTSADAARCASSLFTPRKVFVVRNGLDVKQFLCVEDTPEKKLYVAAVGSLLPVKRWDRLLRAVQRVKRVMREDIHFRIAGDGPLRPVLEKQAEDLGIAQAVEFMGTIHDIPAFLRGAKFLVHTSESEGCPNAVMEAMACGRAIVAMDAGDIPYLVENGMTGFVVRQGDEATLVERVSQLLRDEELCIPMGLAARARAEREFKLERLISETLEVYRVVGRKEER